MRLLNLIQQRVAAADNSFLSRANRKQFDYFFLQIDDYKVISGVYLVV